MYRLIIVDDEEDIRRGMARGIPWTEWGFEVAGQAENGEEAVRMVAECQPDVVLSDIRMPKMDGIELMQYLYENNPEIKIIILSGYHDVEYLNMAIKNRVTEYLLKPTDIDEFEALFHRIKETLDQEQDKKAELEQLKNSVRKNQELSYGRVLNNLLDGYVGGSQEYIWKREMEEKGMDFGRCILVVLNTPAESGGQGDDYYQLKQKIIHYCNSGLMIWEKRFFLHKDRKIIGLITLPDFGNESDCCLEKKEEEARKQVCQCIKEIQIEIGDIFGLPLLAGISPVCHDERMLAKLFQDTEATVYSLAPDLTSSQKRSNLLVAAIKEYLDQTYCSNCISLEMVAEQFKKNPAYISKVFKRGTGFNFSDYITQKRMAKSKVLLKDLSLKIYEIAELTGYADASNYIKVFKKHCGISPNEYRALERV